MDILVGKRRQGKTTHLIKLSAAGEGTIVTNTLHSAQCIKRQAEAMKLDIPDPICWNKLVFDYEQGRPYLVDELGWILKNLGIETAIVGDECTIKEFPFDCRCYGDELAQKIRQNTLDFTKLSDYDRFVLDYGWRYMTQKELQAGYDRRWKAAHDILISMEEFLIEAEKKPSDPATDVYETLVSLVEEKKLRPGEVFDYAHYRWCLNHPEAIIAYQTGRDKWTVSNCDTEITDDVACVKIQEEWGFEAGRVRVIGTPYYDATDYQFIRFNCGHMAWLWRNGDLLQVYC